MTNYEWLCQLKPNSWSIEMNEHACNYVTAKVWPYQKLNPTGVFE